MSYNPNIPIITDFMLQSQRQIKANFQAINTVFSQNHVQINQDLQGMHNVLTFREQSGDPVTASDQTALYIKAVNSQPTLFYRPENSGTPIQITYPSISTGLASTNPDVYIVRQQTFLAAPFVFYSGVLLGVSSGQLITLLPSSTLLYVGLIIRGVQTAGDQNAFATACATNLSVNAFNVQFDSSLPVQNISYIAIGV